MTQISHFYKKIRHGIPLYVYKTLQKRAYSALMREKGLWETLCAYKKLSPSTGCSYSDYLALYREVRRRKPKEILECGTGVSTVALAYALMENEKETGVKGRITSMEELPEYYEQARRIFPKILAPYAEIIRSPSVEDVYGLFRGMRYRDVPDRAYEFVFIDGPNPRAPSDSAQTFDLDFVSVVARSQNAVFGMTDRRVSTCFALHSLLGREHFSYDYIREIGFIGPVVKDDLRTHERIADRIIRAHPYRRAWFFKPTKL